MTIGIIAPADDGAVGLHPAGVVVASANRGEETGGRCGLSNEIAIYVLIGTPANDGAIGLHPAGVKIARTDGCERTVWGSGLANGIATKVLI